MLPHLFKSLQPRKKWDELETCTALKTVRITVLTWRFKVKEGTPKEN